MVAVYMYEICKPLEYRNVKYEIHITMDTNKTEKPFCLVSFNAIPTEWEQFKALAKKAGRPASYYLNQCIKQAILNESVENPKQSIPDMDTAKESIPNMDLIHKQIEILTEKVNSLEPKDDPYPDIEQTIKTTIKKLINDYDQESIKPIKSRLDTVETEIENIQKSNADLNSKSGNFTTKNDLKELEETVLSLLEEKPTKNKVESPAKLEQGILPVEENESTQNGKNYKEDSLNFIAELSRKKISQKEIADLLNQGSFPTKSGKGNWSQSMVSEAIASTTVRLPAKK
jgi:phosphopantetheine adenylyltransferase